MLTSREEAEGGLSPRQAVYVVLRTTYHPSSMMGRSPRGCSATTQTLPAGVQPEAGKVCFSRFGAPQPYQTDL